MNTLLRRPTVRKLTGLSDTGLYEAERGGLFPRAVRLSARAVGYIDYEIEIVQCARIAEKTDDEIRALVQKLHAARASFAGVADAALSAIEKGDGTPIYQAAMALATRPVIV